MIDLGGHLTDEAEDTDQQHGACGLLDVLAGDRTEELLQELLAATGPLSAQELSDRCDIPQSTVYRRLDELTDHGVLREHHELAVDDQDASTYEVVVDGLEVDFTITGYQTNRHGSDGGADPRESPSDDAVVMSFNLTE